MRTIGEVFGVGKKRTKEIIIEVKERVLDDAVRGKSLSETLKAIKKAYKGKELELALFTFGAVVDMISFLVQNEEFNLAAFALRLELTNKIEEVREEWG